LVPKNVSFLPVDKNKSRSQAGNYATQRNLPKTKTKTLKDKRKSISETISSDSLQSPEFITDLRIPSP